MSWSMTTILALIVIFAPLFGCIVIGLWGLSGFKPGEKAIQRLAYTTLLVSAAAALAIGGATLVGDAIFPIKFLDIPLVTIGSHPVHLVFGIDALTLPMTILIVILTGAVAFFSGKYLHRDPGYLRFFLLLLLFDFGMHVITMAMNLGSIFVGWEVIGLTSALLISFYSLRREVVENSLRAFFFYRLSDTALLLAGSLVILQVPETAFTLIPSIGAVVPKVQLSGWQAVVVPMLLLVAAMVKSAQYPFLSWLPRAMEGPTPSSAIFYGGLSIHAGLFLMIRVCHEFDLGSWFCWVIVVVGATTAMLAALFSRVQSDIKTALCLSAASQVGIMFVEVGFGLHKLAMFHLIGHGMFRTYQILVAASIIHEGRVSHTHYHPESSPFASQRLGRFFDRLYCFSFNGALGLGIAGSHSVTRVLEQISRHFGRLEDVQGDRMRGLGRMLVARLERKGSTLPIVIQDVDIND